jgi:hypothetical protein
LDPSDCLACIAAVRADVGKEGAMLELTALLATCPSHDLRRGVEREGVPCEPDRALHDDPAAPRSAPLSHSVSIERGAEDHLRHVAQGNEARMLTSKSGVEARVEEPGFWVEPVLLLTAEEKFGAGLEE